MQWVSKDRNFFVHPHSVHIPVHHLAHKRHSLTFCWKKKCIFIRCLLEKSKITSYALWRWTILIEIVQIKKYVVFQQSPIIGSYSYWPVTFLNLLSSLKLSRLLAIHLQQPHGFVWHRRVMIINISKLTEHAYDNMLGISVYIYTRGKSVV